jgi:hypothetical protein
MGAECACGIARETCDYHRGTASVKREPLREVMGEAFTATARAFCEDPLGLSAAPAAVTYPTDGWWPVDSKDLTRGAFFIVNEHVMFAPFESGAKDTPEGSYVLGGAMAHIYQRASTSSWGWVRICERSKCR